MVLCAKPVEATSHRTWTTYPWLPERLRPDAKVLVDDGAIVLAVTDVSASELRCVVVQGGTVTSGRGISMPGATTVPPGLNDRDADDLRFARVLGVDLVALSFACSLPTTTRCTRSLLTNWLSARSNIRTPSHRSRRWPTHSTG